MSDILTRFLASLSDDSREKVLQQSAERQEELAESWENRAEEQGEDILDELDPALAAHQAAEEIVREAL
ncbi:hypothetical protein LRS74_19520 [Streptomyces sp. LX-29]|uniref:hypothetical protein n=1 Tax=unclassified Streptomyces TaxID=2593676 RepID=UPI0011866C39|nr:MULTISPECIES: hypothetical protein [unclassified Streptomyces]TVL90152.1 hypothetical protein CD790_23745 [Streptomyces sp. SAJ15]WFB08987.1 hypothetical protein LRS74_19520 [Streptomyces sp. LX-29]